MKKIVTKTFLLSLFVITSMQMMAQPALSPAPVPDKDAAEVKSIFSDAYTDLVSSFTFTGTGTTSIATSFDGDEMIHIDTGLNFWTNINFSSTVDIDDKEYLHLDVFVERTSPTDIRIRFDETGTLTFNVAPGWNSLDIPLVNFRNLETPPDLTQIGSLQMIRPGGYAVTIYIDNVYAYGEGSSDPTDPTDPTDPVIVSAPVPTHDAGEVVSMFTDAYTNVVGIASVDLGEALDIS